MLRHRLLGSICLACAALPLLALTGAAAAPPSADAPRQELTAVLDDFWALLLRDDLSTRQSLGLPITRLPDVSEAGHRETAAQARRLLERLERIDPAALSHEDWISREIARWECQQAVDLQDTFWLQPQLTARALPMRPVHSVLGDWPLSKRADLEGYLDLVRQYPGLVRQVRQNLATSHDKGILPPKAMLDIIEPILRAYIQKAEESPLWVEDSRLDGLRRDGNEGAAAVAAFQSELRRLITAEANPALQELADAVTAVRPQAPERAGMSQYPGGEAAYRGLVRYYTTLDIAPEEIHRIGLAEVDRIDARMAELRKKLGITGTRAEAHKKMRTDPRFLAKTPEEVAERLMAPIRRIEPKVGAYFLRTPKAPYGVKRLDPLLEGSTMTFGYYDSPTPASPTGNYRFNGGQLSQRPLLNAAALIYHELVPGHHFQLNLQRENESLPEFRRETTHTAFVEGWGEYASELALEMGLYSDPWDEYGRLSMDMFLSTRLVVDTGMNLLGWSRQKAIDYMLDHVLESETQVTSETLRYSADRPGQALAYKMGSRKLRELRTRAETALGDRFDIRRFHEAVIGSGSMPLAVLEKHIDWWIGEEKKR